jgi:predicted CoA-substrate-specific enzyme activase
MAPPGHRVLGIDIGSVAVGVVVMTPEKEVVGAAYAVHRGDPAAALGDLSASLPVDTVGWVSATTSTPKPIRSDARFDDQICCIAAVRHQFPEARAIFTVGGERFHLIRIGRDGSYRGSRSSTACAAGTGAFLDQQARRLGLPDAARLSRLAFENTARRPRIATRCAVFAKTDLIHAQQEGFSLPAICDGLCRGLAKNITDTVLGSETIAPLVLFCGGVALNRAVRSHLERLIGLPIQVPERPELTGAIGAALSFVDAHLKPVPDMRPGPGLAGLASLAMPVDETRGPSYPPLTLCRSDYPSFESRSQYRYPSNADTRPEAVEVDIYALMARRQRAYLGIDIGSTSTKAVLLGPDKAVLAGFYTRTAGRPLAAVQRLFAAISQAAIENGSRLDILAAGTTGSGRSFVGRIVGADLVLDEITAHARAAWELNPAVDTIIEIGGQDAKFTTLKDGRVTRATMNTVCAAGTGSFIEEQAAKLGCPLSAFAIRTEGRTAPLASDRCTVFMERDLNHLLSEGWDTDAVLAAVLHSVRENYLVKVANEQRIGDVVLFQGATAKNRALVAAFEQRLDKPIHVSRYCHVTGALGTALTLWDEQRSETTFCGFGLCREKIAVRTEVCDLCTNHCKLSVAEVGGETVACGFLCGRDYHTEHYVAAGGGAFDLVRQRRRAFRFSTGASGTGRPTIGLPAAGHLLEDLPRWRFFFDQLGFPTVTSAGIADAVGDGKPLTGAEFCAPITALHGHVRHLADHCDAVFLPIYLENRTGRRQRRRQYCYYTQYAPVLAAAGPEESGIPVLRPLVRYLTTGFHARRELFRMFKSLPGARVSFLELSAALDAADRFHQRRRERLIRAWQDHVRRRSEEIRIALLGRPYTIHSPDVNSRIPELFRRQGIDCCDVDMLAAGPEDRAAIAPLLDEIHWHYAARVLTGAQAVASRTGVYPVLVTAFKCTPDAFVRDYFKTIMERSGKPYLVLELDEHDSSVGYETRIEAAVRSFRNHHRHAASAPARTARAVGDMPVRGKTGKTIVLPNWDRLSGRLLVAVLRREGYRAHLMEETTGTIRRSLRDNTGQCIPINAIVQGFEECLEKNGLAPADTVLWVGSGTIACNLALYPYHVKQLLTARGNGLEAADVYVGDIFFKDINPRAAMNAVFAYMFGGLLRRVACRLRPYETEAGRVDRLLDQGIDRLAGAFLGRERKEDALTAVTCAFSEVPVRITPRPQVAIFGDLYSRDNRVMNQNLIRFIEANGGEVVTTPYTEYARMIASPYFRKWFTEGRYLYLITSKTLMAAVTRQERKYYRYFEGLLNSPMTAFDDPPEAILSRFGVRLEHTGESMENLLKVHYIRKHHPNLALFVQASPAFCCPSLVTEAMSRRIEAVTGVPVVPITYDGTGGSKNDVLVPYLRFPGTRRQKSAAGLDRSA